MPPAAIVEMIILLACTGAAVFVTVVAYKAWQGDKYLCDNCKYNDETSCLKVERPRALDCAAYSKREEIQTQD
jgi:hypothetical protein